MAEPDRPWDPAEPPSDADVRFFEAHGWWVSPVCIPERDLDALQLGVERYLRGERDRVLTTRQGNPWLETARAPLLRGSFLSLQIAAVGAFVRRPLLPRMAARLTRSAQIRLFHDQAWCKAAGGPAATTEIGWHTDKTFWGGCASSRMISAWTPLQDCTLAMGPLAFIDASHRWPGAERRDNTPLADLGPAARVVTVEMKRGQVSFHHCLTLHGSAANVAAAPRMAFCIHYQDGANAYRGRVEEADDFHLNLLLRRRGDGAPDYSDPDVCPVLFQAAKGG